MIIVIYRCQVACCQHGNAAFPQWHRMFVRVFEAMLKLAGADVGVPYWEWTSAFTELPRLVTEGGEIHYQVL